MCTYSPMPHTLPCGALIGECALITLNTVDKYVYGYTSVVSCICLAELRLRYYLSCVIGTGGVNYALFFHV